MESACEVATEARFQGECRSDMQKCRLMRRNQCAKVKIGDRDDKITIHQGVNSPFNSEFGIVDEIALRALFAWRPKN